MNLNILFTSKELAYLHVNVLSETTIKIFPLQACGYKDPHLYIHGIQDDVGWLVLSSTAFTPGESPGTHFIGG